jgi:uncharacterized membrane protein YkoI
MRRNALIIAAGLAGLPTGASAQACFTPEEARHHVMSQGLVPLQEIVGSGGSRATAAELVSARLCEINGTLVYMVAMLERNGKLLRMTVDARSGKVITRR